MLGSLRLLLAIAVALSHVDYRLHGLNPGVMAVVGFYLISGYVMYALIERRYAQPQQAPAFYADRLLRLMPQYLCYAALTLLWYRYQAAAAPPASASLAYFLHPAPSLTELINNLSVVPLNYYMYNGADRFTLIPPAWSLGAELQFYLLAPLLLPSLLLATPRRRLSHTLSRGLAVLLLLLALATLLLALVGRIHSDWFGYRLLPGVLVYFLLGALLAHLHRHATPHVPHAARTLVILGLGATLLVAAASHALDALQQPYNQEVLLGLLISLPLVHLLARRRRRAWDELAGDLSYGVFLNHFLVHWALFPAGVAPSQLPAFLGVSLIASWLTQRLIERPCLNLRSRLRRDQAGGGGVRREA